MSHAGHTPHTGRERHPGGPQDGTRTSFPVIRDQVSLAYFPQFINFDTRSNTMVAVNVRIQKTVFACTYNNRYKMRAVVHV